eukprot:TRINITY_DN4807_c0_g1_i1.p1 TRINITY_DN4807_c0_g1~~TRINITY_DN4807_c0_g1_i1.p1  ORF type:complete len:279 (-),score=18.88 TRINITY_DN4807_c0_g1_i1:80-916(-)
MDAASKGGRSNETMHLRPGKDIGEKETPRASFSSQQPMDLAFHPIFGTLLATGAVTLHILPSVLLMVSYCDEYGCAQPGCRAQDPIKQCVPAYSNTILRRQDDGPSQTRHFLALLLVCLRAPLVCIAFRFAYRHLNLCLGRCDAESESRVRSFELIMIVFVLLDIMVVFLPNSGWRKIWHILASFTLMCVWTLIIIPMLGEVISLTQKDPDSFAASMVWGMWYSSCGLGTWLFISWFLEPGTQWYLSEWLFILIQGFQVIAVGIALQGCQTGAVSCDF